MKCWIKAATTMEIVLQAKPAVIFQIGVNLKPVLANAGYRYLSKIGMNISREPIEFVHNIIRHAPQFHRRSLRHLIVRHLCICQPEDLIALAINFGLCWLIQTYRIPNEDHACHQPSSNFIYPHIVICHPYRSICNMTGLDIVPELL